MSDVALPAEADGWNGPATDDILRLALELMVQHAGGRIVIPARTIAKIPDGSLAYGFSGPHGENLDLGWVRHKAPEGMTATPPALDQAAVESSSIRFGMSLLVLEAGGRMRVPPFDVNAMPEGVLTYGSEPNGDYSLTLTPTGPGGLL